MDTTYTNELWKRVICDDLSESEIIEVSNHGRIRSFKSKKEGGIILNGFLLRGYRAITLKNKSGINATKYIHKLVAEAFIPKDHELQQYVIHRDFNKVQNHVDNLAWVTKQTMYEHHKMNSNYKKFKINNSKLSETEVIRLKMKLKRGKNKLYKIAKEFGITHTQVNRIKNGENWSHIKID